MKRVRDSDSGPTLTVAFLLPDDPPPSLLSALPASTDDVRILRLASTDEMPSEQLSAVTWVPPTKPARLTALLDAHPEVQWVHSLSAGVDYIGDVIKTKLLQSPTLLSNGRGAFSDSLAEYAIAAALYFTKEFKRCEKNRVERRWDRFTMPVVAGKTMGFVGWGHIGQSTAKLAQPLGMRLIGLRRHPERPAAPGEPALAAVYGADRSAEFYAQCDFVVCSLPLTEDTRKAVSADCFSAMKASCVFISLGRGAAVDEDALYNALKKGTIAGAACDVFATEPLPADSPLWECDNLLMTAHNADLTEDYFELAVGTWRDNLECFQRGAPLATPVDKHKGY